MSCLFVCLWVLVSVGVGLVSRVGAGFMCGCWFHGGAVPGPPSARPSSSCPYLHLTESSPAHSRPGQVVHNLGLSRDAVQLIEMSQEEVSITFTNVGDAVSGLRASTISVWFLAPRERKRHKNVEDRSSRS